jgi:hypothetical protein
MCFSESQSYINTFILLCISYYFINKEWKIALPAAFLASKDLLQGLLYRYHNDKYISKVIARLSWINISFQPLVINIFLSYFDNNNKQYWNVIFLALFIFGCYYITTLSAFDIQNDEDCNNDNSDFCSDTDGAYIGKYHIAYKFKTELGYNSIPIILMILPALFTKAWKLSLVWLFFIILIATIFNKNVVRTGEQGAIWCFLSIIPFIPVVYYRSYFKKL